MTAVQTVQDIQSYDTKPTQVLSTETPSQSIASRILPRRTKWLSYALNTKHMALTDKPVGETDIPTELKIIDLPKFKPTGRPSSASIAAMQEWEGVVTEVVDGSLHAQLIDITQNRSVPTETLELPLDELPDEDRIRAVPGAVFRWTIGYLRTEARQRYKVSTIYFRKLGSIHFTPSNQPSAFDFEDEQSDGA